MERAVLSPGLKNAVLSSTMPNRLRQTGKNADASRRAPKNERFWGTLFKWIFSNVPGLFFND